MPTLESHTQPCVTGSFTFRWPYPAEHVYVTGTFDDWGKTVQLDNIGGAFEKEVQLPRSDEKIFYKFIVDNNWIVDYAAPYDDDGHYNINNVVLPHQLHGKESKPPSVGLGPSGIQAQQLPSPSPVSIAPVRPRSPQRPIITSYWSVPEQQKLHQLVAYYGKDYGKMADFMKTKSPAMIKNQYSREIAKGNTKLERSAQNAERMMARGELQGRLPSPINWSIKKYALPPSMPTMSSDQGLEVVSSTTSRRSAAQSNQGDLSKSNVLALEQMCSQVTEENPLLEMQDASVKGPDLLKDLRSLTLPPHRYKVTILPREAMVDRRWVCVLCPKVPFNATTQRSSDMRKHLMGHHHYLPKHINYVFNPREKEHLFAYFGPYTEDEALKNGLKVMPYRKDEITTAIPALAAPVPLKPPLDDRAAK